MGLKSAGARGVETLGRGRIVASFHYRETPEDESDKLNISTNGAVKNGAPSFRSQTGISSRPVAIGRSLSKMLKSRRFVIGTIGLLWLAVVYTFGGS